MNSPEPCSVCGLALAGSRHSELDALPRPDCPGSGARRCVWAAQPLGAVCGLSARPTFHQCGWLMRILCSASQRPRKVRLEHVAGGRSTWLEEEQALHELSRTASSCLLFGMSPDGDVLPAPGPRRYQMSAHIPGAAGRQRESRRRQPSMTFRSQAVYIHYESDCLGCLGSERA